MRGGPFIFLYMIDRFFIVSTGIMLFDTVFAGSCGWGRPTIVVVLIAVDVFSEMFKSSFFGIVADL